MISDILLTRPATEWEMSDMALLSGCVSDPLIVEEYTTKIRDTGFHDVRFEAEQDPKEGQFWFSAAVSAIKS